MRKTIWLVVSCLLVLALVLSSCSSADEDADEPTTTPPKTVTPTPEPEPTGPQYGGVLYVQAGGNPSTFDPVSYPQSAWQLDLSHDGLLNEDYLKGPSGTGEFTLSQNMPMQMENTRGSIAESWEMLDPDTYLFHIRKGIHWHDKPPSNGRELVVDDVIKFFERVMTEYAYILSSYNYFVSVTDVGDNTIQVKMEPGSGAFVWPIFASWMEVTNWEVIEEQGDYKNWETQVGTGPFLLTDYVAGSSLTYERNPNYYLNDPRSEYSGNQLPYVDGVKIMIIPDRSTLLASFRSGKIDTVFYRWLDEVKPLRTVPGIVEVPFLDGAPWSVNLTMDRPELPTYDLRVRQALSIAIDREEVMATLMGGEALLQAYPAMHPEVIDAYTPYEDLTELAKYSYKYDPDEARQLLADAGYPNGFATTILTEPVHEEMVSVIAAYWAKIGVTATIDLREASVVSSIRSGKTWDDLIGVGRPDAIHISRMSDLVPGGVWNVSNMDDPEVNALMQDVRDVFHDTKAQHAALKILNVRALELVPWAMLPIDYRYNLYWDWVNNYSGEWNVGYQRGWRYAEYIWLDTDRKAELGY